MKARKKLNTKKTIPNNKIVTDPFPIWLMCLCLFFLPNFAEAQLTFQHWQQFREARAFDLQIQQLPKFFYNNKNTKLLSHFDHGYATAFSSTVVFTKLPDYAEFNELGWFCTFDLKLDLKMTTPLRFRLGTLEEVNRKEGYW